MLYVAATPLIMPFPCSVVFAALLDLARYPKWNCGMISISPEDVIQEGMRYRTSMRICGITNNTMIAVERVIANESIEISSKSGLIAFRALYQLVENSSENTELIYTLRFEFKGFIFNAPRSIIESMARSRSQYDLIALRDLIASDENKTPTANVSQNSRRQ